MQHFYNFVKYWVKPHSIFFTFYLEIKIVFFFHADEKTYLYFNSISGTHSFDI